MTLWGKASVLWFGSKRLGKCMGRIVEKILVLSLSKIILAKGKFSVKFIIH